MKTYWDRVVIEEPTDQTSASWIYIPNTQHKPNEWVIAASWNKELPVGTNVLYKQFQAVSYTDKNRTKFWIIDAEDVMVILDD
jgi:co-chaperonin GroES (HSP10)